MSTMRFLLPVVVGAWLGSGFPVAAQISGGATDNELYAAFCSGVLAEWESEAPRSDPKPTLETTEREIRQMMPPGMNSDELHRMAEASLARRLKDWNEYQAQRAPGDAARQAQQRRFTAYLMARGVLTDPTRAVAVLGITVATGQGRQAGKQCSAVISHCIEAPTAPADCLSTEPCPKVLRCSMPDALPF
jgi:hypothetical protein